jgi:hypothetical protein
MTFSFPDGFFLEAVEREASAGRLRAYVANVKLCKGPQVL